MVQPQENSQTSQHSPQNQKPTMSSHALAAVQSPMASSQWGEWTLHGSGLHYWRARFVSYETAASIGVNARNSIVPDGQGRYVHYEFVGTNDVATRHYYPSPMLQTLASPGAMAMAADTTSASPQQLLQVPDYDDDGASGCSDASQAASGVQQPVIDIETSEDMDMVKVSFAEKSEGHSAVLDKKTRKRLDADKKRRVNTKAKVDTWLKV
ncbi:hypothetical protein AK830_g8319 [Neonectria ditissima]|uniref:Uncharacterized protein n=1 Tax=Neonectria ditissima TaxID=78410 RepID=A0A0P7AKQ1_9HYPO|nr:hypothetical protein AK830_g8319 [Neonectria ditissima]